MDRLADQIRGLQRLVIVLSAAFYVCWVPPHYILREALDDATAPLTEQSALLSIDSLATLSAELGDDDGGGPTARTVRDSAEYLTLLRRVLVSVEDELVLRAHAMEARPAEARFGVGSPRRRLKYSDLRGDGIVISTRVIERIGRSGVWESADLREPPLLSLKDRSSDASELACAVIVAGEGGARERRRIELSRYRLWMILDDAFALRATRPALAQVPLLLPPLEDSRDTAVQVSPQDLARLKELAFPADVSSPLANEVSPQLNGKDVIVLSKAARAVVASTPTEGWDDKWVCIGNVDETVMAELGRSWFGADDGSLAAAGIAWGDLEADESGHPTRSAIVEAMSAAWTRNLFEGVEVRRVHDDLVTIVQRLDELEGSLRVDDSDNLVAMQAKLDGEFSVPGLGVSMKRGLAGWVLAATLVALLLRALAHARAVRRLIGDRRPIWGRGSVVTPPRGPADAPWVQGAASSAMAGTLFGTPLVAMILLGATVRSPLWITDDWLSSLSPFVLLAVYVVLTLLITLELVTAWAVNGERVGFLASRVSRGYVRFLHALGYPKRCFIARFLERRAASRRG